jgi:hypothetical protein
MKKKSFQFYEGKKYGVILLLAIMGMTCITTCKKKSLTISCADFEGQPLGVKYTVSDVIYEPGVDIFVQPFQQWNGNWTNDGNVRINNNGASGGSGRDAWINNVNLCFDFYSSLQGLSLNFGDYGGNLNIEINGEFINTGFLYNLPANIGGVSITVSLKNNSTFNYHGTLTLFGRISSFTIDGQELFIDDVCPEF